MMLDMWMKPLHLRNLDVSNFVAELEAPTIFHNEILITVVVAPGIRISFDALVSRWGEAEAIHTKIEGININNIGKEKDELIFGTEWSYEEILSVWIFLQLLFFNIW